MPLPAFYLAPGPQAVSIVLENDIDSRALLRGIAPAQPLMATVVDRGVIRDLVYVGDVTVLAVSTAFAEAIRDLTGVELVPLTIRGAPDPRWVLSVHGRCGRADWRSSRVVKRFGRSVRLVGMHLTSEADADFTVPENLDVVIVSRAAAASLKRARLKNVSLTPLEDYRIDVPASDLPDHIE